MKGAKSPCELMKPFTASLSQSGLTCARVATRVAASRTFSTGRNQASTSWVDGRTAYARHMTAPPTKNNSPSVPEERSSSFNRSNSPRRSAWVRGAMSLSDLGAERRVDENVATPEGRGRVRQQVQAQALQGGSEGGL